MRVMVHVQNAEGGHEDYHDLDSLPDDLQGVLAYKDRQNLRLQYSDRVVTYGPIEFDCQWCGSYEHKDDDCPDLDDDPELDNEEPMLGG